MTRNNDERQMVLFTQNCSPYLSGERAAFGIREATRLRDRKLAVFVDSDGSVEKPIITVGDAGITKEAKNDGHNEQNDDDGIVKDGAEKGSGKGKGKKSKTGGGKKRRERL